MTEIIVSIFENHDLIPHHDYWCKKVKVDLDCTDDGAGQIVRIAYDAHLNGSPFRPDLLAAGIKNHDRTQAILRLTKR